MHMYIKIDTGTCTDMYMYLHVHTCKDTTVAGRILFDSTLLIFAVTIMELYQPVET